MRRFFAFAAVLLAAAPALGDWDDARAAYYRGDYETAFEEFLPYAQEGDAEAQAMVGVMYQGGYGVRQDLAEAGKWYRRAADQCHAAALGMLGVLYAQGLGVPLDYIAAYKLLSVSSALGERKASEALDLLVSFMTREQIAEAKRRSATLLSTCR